VQILPVAGEGDWQSLDREPGQWKFELPRKYATIITSVIVVTYFQASPVGVRAYCSLQTPFDTLSMSRIFIMSNHLFRLFPQEIALFHESLSCCVEVLACGALILLVGCVHFSQFRGCIYSYHTASAKMNELSLTFVTVFTGCQFNHRNGSHLPSTNTSRILGGVQGPLTFFLCT